MGIRVLFVASISTALAMSSEIGLAQDQSTDGPAQDQSSNGPAQDQSTDGHLLPTVRVQQPTQHPKHTHPKVVAAPAVRAPPPAPAVSTPAVPTPAPTADLYPTSPLLSGGIQPDKVPAAVSVVGTSDIQRTGSPIITDALRQSIPSTNITEVAGNPFQPNLEFRGFVASPVSGTPQGLAVYQRAHQRGLR
jgi:hypothetical protein